MQQITQYGQRPFEIFTIPHLFDDKVAEWKEYVASADVRNRTFTCAEFKNGKMIRPDISGLMWDRMKPYLPETYTDATGQRWKFTGTTKYIMYAMIEPNQSFPIHTDTGADYSNEAESKFTVLVYLNDDFVGGRTQFYDDVFCKTRCVVPQPGVVVAFDINLFHAGMMVTQGTKYWIGTELVCSRNP